MSSSMGLAIGILCRPINTCSNGLHTVRGDVCDNGTSLVAISKSCLRKCGPSAVNIDWAWVLGTWRKHRGKPNCTWRVFERAGHWISMSQCKGVNRDPVGLGVWYSSLLIFRVYVTALRRLIKSNRACAVSRTHCWMKGPMCMTTLSSRCKESIRSINTSCCS